MLGEKIVKRNLEDYIVYEKESLINALKKIDANRQGFVVVVDDNLVMCGVLTDGDIRRALIEDDFEKSTIEKIFTKNAKAVNVNDDFETVTELFKNQAIKFLPIIDKDRRLVNIITKSQMHALLLQDIQADLMYDFFSLETSVLDHEIFQRPWGYYKTTVLNDYFQAKIISIKPGEQLSLQSHNHREEYWIIVHGNGTVQLDKSIFPVSCGSTIFIPLGCKHRLKNTDIKESLIISEVQIGDYFGEDDIIRYEDVYGRV